MSLLPYRDIITFARAHGGGAEVDLNDDETAASVTARLRRVAKEMGYILTPVRAPDAPLDVVSVLVETQEERYRRSIIFARDQHATLDVKLPRGEDPGSVKQELESVARELGEEIVYPTLLGPIRRTVVTFTLASVEQWWRDKRPAARVERDAACRHLRPRKAAALLNRVRPHEHTLRGDGSDNDTANAGEPTTQHAADAVPSKPRSAPSYVASLPENRLMRRRRVRLARASRNASDRYQ